MAMRQKETQLNVRATSRQKEKLALAARLKEMNLSQFILSQSLEAADEVIAEQSRLVLSTEGFDSFAKLLEEPPKVIPQLRTLFEEPSILES